MTSAPVATLADLARLAGTSVATVSRALAGSPLIAGSTRAKVLALAEAHGFQINQAARNLRLKRTGAIGVILPLGHETEQHVSDPFFMSLLGPLADELAARGYDLLLSRVIPGNGRWLDGIVDSGRFDGMIVIGQSNQSEAIERVAARYKPMVIWGATLTGCRQITVGSDNFAGGFLAAKHLLARGCRRLAFFGNPDVPEFMARHRGVMAAAAAAGVEPPTLLPVHLTSGASYAAIQDFLGSNPVPDGIVAASDVIAMSALRVLADRKQRVPQDVAVVGYDDIVIAMHTSPPLTTIRQDVERGAGLLVDLLMQRIEGKEVQSVAMDPQLIVRGTA